MNVANNYCTNGLHKSNHEIAEGSSSLATCSPCCIFIAGGEILKDLIEDRFVHYPSLGFRRK